MQSCKLCFKSKKLNNALLFNTNTSTQVFKRMTRLLLLILRKQEQDDDDDEEGEELDI